MIINYLGTAPTRAHRTDAGADLRAKGTYIVPVNGARTIPTGTAVAIPEGHVGIVAIRSSLAFKRNLTLVNGVGVIDSDYRGEISVRIANLGDEPQLIQDSERIAQLIVMPIELPTFELAETLTETERGGDGFGSTGTI